MTNAGRILAAMAMLSFPAAASDAKPVVKAVTSADWTHTFDHTEAGGYRVGNPRAKIAVVEYGSLTCSHCRHFAASAVKPLLTNYVRSGKASYEFRPFVLNGIDLAATLVARCSGPARFFPMAEQLYATQPAWSEKVGQLPQSERDKLDALPQGEFMLAVAKTSGLYSIAAAHGIPAARAEQCLKDQGAANGLMKMIKTGDTLGVHGTPTIFVNGKQVSAYDWASLEPFLKDTGT